MNVSGAATVGGLISNNGFAVHNAGVELYGNTPYIDFHCGNSTADYTSRIIEWSSGQLEINGVKISGGAIDATNIWFNGQTIYNRLASDRGYTYNWRCTEGGNLNPYTSINTNSANKVNIGNTAAYIKNLYYGGSLSKQSDRRIKNPIGELTEDEMLTILSGSKIQKFTYKSDKLQGVNYGVYAQDLRDLLITSGIGHISMLGIDLKDSDGEQTKDLTTPEENVQYTVDYSQYAPVLVKGWQHHDRKIANLEMKNNEAEAKIENLTFQLEEAFSKIFDLKNKLEKLEKKLESIA